nr:putative serine/threonine/dual specificity protein kinase, catalytic domain-containing protein [Tanacetum cinerariifolium]
MSGQGACEYEAEINVLSKIRHGNLVSLIGYCNEGTEMVLIYEFLPNGTLKDHLHKDDTELSWLQRLKICIGAARGLDYLHTGIATRHGVIHRDVKTSNILLDANFEAKVSDFGLAKVGQTNQTITHVSTTVKGTFGYMDPSYFLSGKLTRKSDVYAFGVVLFEVLSGRQAVDPTIDEYQWSLAVWAQDQINEGNLNQIVDPKLKGQISKKSLKEFASIAVDCLHSHPKKRPTMAEVVVKIDSILSQERKCTDSFVNEGTFINKLKSLFISKVDMMSSHAMESTYEIMAHPVEKSSNQCWREFTIAEIVILTDTFEHEQCWVDERTYIPTERGAGLAIYVTREDLEMPELIPSSGERNFVELQLEKFTHPNLIKLLGYCLDKNELYCVYELNPNTRLDRLLSKAMTGTTSLPWSARLKIAIGAAQGLSFLHQRNHIAYIQFKTSVILVDKDYHARLSDFVVIPYLGQYTYPFLNDAFYAAPEWFEHQALTLDYSDTTQDDFESDYWIKSEIYAFGVVLLEILTGMKVFDANRSVETQNLVKWAIPLLADVVNLGRIMDPQLQLNDCPPKGAFKFALLVSKCLQPYAEKRPSMRKIIQVLYECHQD